MELPKVGWGRAELGGGFYVRKGARGWLWVSQVLTGVALTSARLRAANGQLSSVLLQAYLPVVDYQICSSSSYWGSTVKPTMVCAGGDGIRSGCQVWPRHSIFPLASHWHPHSSHLIWVPRSGRVIRAVPSTAR